MKFRVLFALLALGGATSAYAADNCSVDITGNDKMQYNINNIDVPKSCTTFTIHLSHVGKAPKNVMGHNVVIAKTSDMAGIEADAVKGGIAGGLPNNFVKPGDARVIAHSNVVGGGESTSVSVPVASLVAVGAPLSFFCSFPGHSAMMKGTVTLK